MRLLAAWPISFEEPQWLWLLAVIPLIVLVSLRSLAGLEPYRRVLAVALRCAVIAALAACLARIQFVREHDNVAVMFVFDRSRSVPVTKSLEVKEYIRKIARGREGASDKEDRIGIVGFDGRADIDLIPSRVGIQDEKAFDFGLAVEPDRTNIAEGVRLAMAAFPQGYARRIVLVTDGNENSGNLVDEVETATANGISIDVLPLEYAHRNEILFDRIITRPHEQEDTNINVRMMVQSRKPTDVRLRLYHNGKEVPVSEPIRRLHGDFKPTAITEMVQLFGGGVHRFDAIIEPLDPDSDSMPENNRATSFTFVDAQGRVLLLKYDDPAEPTRNDEAALASALRREKIDLDVRDVTDMYIDLLSLQEYGVVILSNVPADVFNEQQHKALASYVKDFGGGLIMTGGKQAFGAGGWIGQPIEEVSPVAFDIKHKQQMPRGALAIIMHSCEIPRGNFWGEQVAIASVRALSSRDYLGVICYNPMMGGANWDVPMALLTNKQKVIQQIKQMQIGDMPDFGPTIRNSVTALTGLQGVSQRHIIIISDGDPRPPTESDFQLLETNQITVSTVGIGYGQHVVEQTLRTIASRTKGNFYRCTNPNNLPQIFIKEARVVRRRLVDEEVFAPQVGMGFSDLLAGIQTSSMPQLGGIVLTEPKPEITMPLVRQNKDNKSDPLLAYWNYEMGKMAVFTSGWWTNWGQAWAGWEQFGKFWSQAVRWAMRQAGSADFHVITRLEGNRGKVSIEALDKDASYLNFVRFQGLVTLPSMDSKPLQIRQTGPGTYETEFDVHDDGNYLVNLRYTDPQGNTGLIRTGLSVPYSPEFRELETNKTLLEQVINLSGGRRLSLDSDAKDVFSRQGLAPSVSRQPVWRWVLAWLLLPLFLLDVASRRLASALAMSIYVELAVFAVMFGLLSAMRASIWGYIGAVLLAEAFGWAIRWRYIVPTLQFLTMGARSLGRAGQRSSASLSQLKGVRDRVREDMDKPEPPSKPGVTRAVPLEGTADPKSRFDVGDKAASAPAADLAESVSGAVASDPSQGDKPGRGPKPGAEESKPGETTSRLLRAKRRARDQMKKEDE